jgi:hypothetical protein
MARNTARIVVLGGFTVAVLDIINAMLFWYIYKDVPPMRILQSIAAGLLGKDAYAGGPGSAALGALLHFLIACGMALAYVLVSRLLPTIAQRPLMAGLLFGLGAYAVMTYLVVPLSRASAVNKYLWWTVDSVAAHILLVGVPLAYMARRMAVSRPQ